MLIAKAHNSSATYIFVYLFILDLEEFGEAVTAAMEGVVPTDLATRPIKHLQILDLKNYRLTKITKFGQKMYSFNPETPRSAFPDQSIFQILQKTLIQDSSTAYS